MILECTYEELRALASGAELVLTSEERGGGAGVAAPAESHARILTLQGQGTDPIRVRTLADQRQLREAIAVICEHLHERMEATVLQFHPAHEDAVNLYFDYAHAFGVLNRVDEMGAEMRAMLELMTGEASTTEQALEFNFPD